MSKKYIALVMPFFITLCTTAQRVALPAFTKWENNNAPDCKNVVLTKDSIVLPVKNKCKTEGQFENWRPLASVTNKMLKFKVQAGKGVQLSITYKFSPISTDVMTFYGSYDADDGSGDVVSRFFVATNGQETTLAPSGNYTTAVLKINFTDDNNNPVWKALTDLTGTMNFSFCVSTNGGETHQGSRAVIKEVKLEVIN